MSIIEKKPLGASRRLFVLKFSGKIIVDKERSEQIINDIACLYQQNIDFVIVHGASTLISGLCDLLNINVRFVNGQRVTDEKVLDIVQMVMMGKVNPHFVFSLNDVGVNAVGLSGHSASLLKASPLDSELDLGFVGEVTEVNTELIRLLLLARLIPVIAPLGVSNSGQTYNINADNAAAKIAIDLGADKLFFFSDVDGLYENLDDKQSRIDYLSKQDLRMKLTNKTITGGMLPKLQCTLNALENGVKQVCILDINRPKNLINSVNNNESAGTVFE